MIVLRTHGSMKRGMDFQGISSERKVMPGEAKVPGAMDQTPGVRFQVP